MLKNGLGQGYHSLIEKPSPNSIFKEQISEQIVKEPEVKNELYCKSQLNKVRATKAKERTSEAKAEMKTAYYQPGMYFKASKKINALVFNINIS